MTSAEFGETLKVRIMRSKALSHKHRSHAKYSRFDLNWDDENLFPEVVYPDAEFLFRRMNEATLEITSPRSGEVILDIGCGRGMDGVELANKGAIVIGLEPSPVMINHAGKYISENRANMSLVRGVGENLPFRAKSADKVMCKGALDHFPEPAVVIEQMATVLKPGGKVIIAIANFDSLGFKLGRAIWRLRKMLGFKPHEGRMLWEIPEDHTRSFDYSFLKHLVDKCLKLEEVSGVSLFFGVPWWGIFLARLPRNVSTGILNSLDKMARHFPSMSDVVVMRCTPK
jgi:SAM-dependent methyltransferase